MSVLRPLGPSQKLQMAYDTIKKAIQTLELPPGEPLVESRLAEKLQISKTPVREALSRLEHTGLVVATPYKGYSVAPLTAADIESIMSIRSVLEGLAARQACEHLTPDDLPALDRLVDDARAAAEQQDWDRAGEIGHEVHMQVHRLSGDRRLVKMIQILNDQFDRVRLVSTRVPGRLPHSVDEHADIVAALAARDADRAEQLMRSHLLAVRDDVLSSDGWRAHTESTARPAS